VLTLLQSYRLLHLLSQCFCNCFSFESFLILVLLQLVAREKELDALRQDLTNLSRTLETASVQEKEELRREQASWYNHTCTQQQAHRAAHALATLRCDSEQRHIPHCVMQARLARESIRLEALQGSVMSDKEDLKVQVCSMLYGASKQWNTWACLL
jgi:hypothetical protein